MTDTPIPAGLRVALYHRCSTLDQDETLARRALESWTERQGGHVALLVEETGSGARNDRPGLQRVLEAARRGEVDVVVVWKLDRWGRSALDVLANIETLSTIGVRFVAISQSLDVEPGGSAMSRLMLGMLSVVAEFERDLIRERTHLGLERARDRGVQLGRPREDGPRGAQVLKLRASSPPMSWSKVAAKLGCTVAMARRRAEEERS